MAALVAPFRLPEAPTVEDLVAKYFRVLGDPTRLRILGLLRQAGPLSVNEIVLRLGTSQPRISNHLACLRWCGFVSTSREGRAVHYEIADERVVSVLDVGCALLSDNREHVAACCHVSYPEETAR
jgi:DNA-binding transcriptional ArsR family regulator